MTPEEFESERRQSARELDQLTSAVGEREIPRDSPSVLGPLELPEPVTTPSAPADSSPPRWKPPTPPDLGPVNESWSAAASRPSGGLSSLLDGSRERDRQVQVKFNSDQVQLDNAMVSWTAEHFAATHSHYDAVIAGMQKRMDDIDTRHRELERELVRHVHEMARRIDVVLGEGEKGYVSHEAALRSLRERLRTIEEKLR